MEVTNQESVQLVPAVETHEQGLLATVEISSSTGKTYFCASFNSPSLGHISNIEPEPDYAREWTTPCPHEGINAKCKSNEVSDEVKLRLVVQ